jgi:hypothetical protein
MTLLLLFAGAQSGIVTPPIKTSGKTAVYIKRERSELYVKREKTELYVKREGNERIN